MEFADFLPSLAAIAGIIFVLWGISLAIRDVSIVDIFWGLGFVFIAWFSQWMAGHSSTRTMLLVMMVTIWGARLGIYLGRRNWGKKEDYRYAAMREKHGSAFPIVSLVTVFSLQGLLMWFISMPIQVAILKSIPWHPVVWFGVIVWSIGLFFESVGDYQLARFKSDPSNQGKVMDRGLWHYTRHPNYFGDFCVWWGFYLTAVESGSWWWTILSPILMTFLLLRVSGVRLLENSLRSRVDGYDEYARITSPFFPLPRSKSSASS
ncbi:3-oxo-5-alpha-steroid 4-dehydrogenase [Planctomycetes bacterium CA13]|uniref:3-oxo-5-alpha-steroid 4-dehydrogenase n=1 Tax=Novipirellula herctigrandis TaxID=2527986 RepID=A0A5C5Z485_9BACT|nr:3-oxo-5-alpha-steroid 4-dehydrogenase [Planctomycetes bacterium CA13]